MIQAAANGRNPKKQTDKETDRLTLMFENAPRLVASYRVKNNFLKGMHSEFSKAVKPALIDRPTVINQLNLPEFEDCSRAYHNWFHEILNS